MSSLTPEQVTRFSRTLTYVPLSEEEAAAAKQRYERFVSEREDWLALAGWTTRLLHELPPYTNRQWDTDSNLAVSAEMARQAADGCAFSRDCLRRDAVRAIVRAAKADHPWALQGLRAHGHWMGATLNRICAEEGVDLPKLLDRYSHQTQRRLDY